MSEHIPCDRLAGKTFAPPTKTASAGAFCYPARVLPVADSHDYTAARVVTLDGEPPLASAAARLRDALSEIPSDGTPTLVRVQHRVQPVDGSAWLAAQPAGVRFYWEDRDEDAWVAGTGTAMGGHTERLVHLFDVATQHDSLRFVLTVRFDPSGEQDEAWEPFGPVRAYLPEIELRHEDGATWLGCHVFSGPELPTRLERVRQALDWQRIDPPAQERKPALADDTDAARAHWTDNVQGILDEIHAARLEKAVLARRTKYVADTELCPVQILRALSAEQPHTFRFCVEPEPGVAFVGASPELLYRRRDTTIESDALAGTRPRDANPERDRALAEELQRSNKDLREHRLVCRHIETRLRGLCDAVESSNQPEVKKLPYVQHLRTVFRGQLSAGVRDGQVLDALHPTPAVCGHPEDAALAQIAAREGFDRGLYGGAVGCLARDRADCAVAIRSALVRGRELTLFAGAGIVDGSSAQEEWNETTNKLRAFAPIVGAS